MKKAEVRFYFDEDVLKLAHTIARLRYDCTYPGDPGVEIHKHARPPCPIAKGTKDPIWLPQVTEWGWLIISRDHKIRSRPRELQAVRDSGARMVALSGPDAGNTWTQLELLMRSWREIERLQAEEPGPFIHLASRSGVRPIDLSTG